MAAPWQIGSLTFRRRSLGKVSWLPSGDSSRVQLDGNSSFFKLDGGGAEVDHPPSDATRTHSSLEPPRDRLPGVGPTLILLVWTGSGNRPSPIPIPWESSRLYKEWSDEFGDPSQGMSFTSRV